MFALIASTTSQSSSSPARCPWLSLTVLEPVDVDEGEGEPPVRAARPLDLGSEDLLVRSPADEHRSDRRSGRSEEPPAPRPSPARLARGHVPASRRSSTRGGPVGRRLSADPPRLDKQAVEGATGLASTPRGGSNSRSRREAARSRASAERSRRAAFSIPARGHRGHAFRRLRIRLVVTASRSDRPSLQQANSSTTHPRSPRNARRYLTVKPCLAG